MLRKLVLPVVLFCTLIAPAVASAQKLVFVVRHAERADDGSMARESDPRLSVAGEARAAKLGGMLVDAGISAIYATQFRRTQDTAKPLASRLKMEVELMPATTEAVVAMLKARHPNDVVLLVGHSNTVPAIVKALGGPEVTIGDTEYDNLFVIVPSTGTMTRIRY